MNKLLDLIRHIPPNSEIPCLYLFEDDNCYADGLIISSTSYVYLKHNHISLQGSGDSYKDFKYSWFLYSYKDKEYDFDGISDIVLYSGSISLGEL